MNKLFVLSGASGAGKSTMLNELVMARYGIAAIKYSDRKRFNTIDDVSSVEDILAPDLQCDLVYSMYGHKYGFSSKKLKDNLNEDNLFLITNDKMTIETLKNMFPNRIVVVYIVSNINENILKKIYLRRYGFPSIKAKEHELLNELRKGQDLLADDKTEALVGCMERINGTIDRLIDKNILEDIDFKLRLESIKNVNEVYTAAIFDYDYVVLNLYAGDTCIRYSTLPAYNQLVKIINKETGGSL